MKNKAKMPESDHLHNLIVEIGNIYIPKCITHSNSPDFAQALQ
jgi:hypothetical protein